MGFVDTREKRETSKLTHEHLTELANAIMDNKITRNSAKTALQEMVITGKSLIEIISEQDLDNVSDESTISSIIDEVLNEEANVVQEVKENPEAVNFLVGKVMKKSKGKADPSITLKILKQKLSIT